MGRDPACRRGGRVRSRRPRVPSKYETIALMHDRRFPSQPPVGAVRERPVAAPAAIQSARKASTPGQFTPDEGDALMTHRLQDKVIIVTGASRGLGQYTALGMAAEGAKVVVAARTEQ